MYFLKKLTNISCKIALEGNTVFIFEYSPTESSLFSLAPVKIMYSFR